MVEPVLIIGIITAAVTGITAILQVFQSAKIHDLTIDSSCCAIDVKNTTNNYENSNDY